MPYTDKFIKLPIKIVNYRMEAHMEEMGVEGTSDENLPVTFMKLDPNAILAYYSSSETDEDFEEENFNITMVETLAGQSYQILLSVDKFEKLINDHKENLKIKMREEREKRRIK